MKIMNINSGVSSIEGTSDVRFPKQTKQHQYKEEVLHSEFEAECFFQFKGDVAIKTYPGIHPIVIGICPR